MNGKLLVNTKKYKMVSFPIKNGIKTSKGLDIGEEPPVDPGLADALASGSVFYLARRVVLDGAKRT